MAKKFKGTLEEGFLDFVETNGQESFGYINVTTRDKKVGRLYVRFGTIIAIDNRNYKTNIFERVTSIEGFHERSADMLRQRFPNDEGNINIVEAALDQQMASDKELSRVVKENFIDSFYDMWGWGPAVLEWVPSKDPEVPTVPSIQPADLIQKAQLIESKVANEIAPMLGVEPEEILSLVPQIGDNRDYEELRPNEQTILQYANGDHTLEDIVYGTGISLSGSQFATARLWLNRHLFLARSSGELIVFETEEPEQVEPEPIQEESYEAETTPVEETYNPEPETVEEAYTEEDVEPAPEPETSPEPAPEPDEDDEDGEELNNFFSEEVTEKSATPAHPETHVRRRDLRPGKLTFQEALEMTSEPEDIFDETAEPKDVTSELLNEIEQDGLASPGSSPTNSRLTAIVTQLKELLNEAHKSLRDSDEALNHKKGKLEELYTQKQEIDTRISEEEEEYSNLVDNNQTLYNEYTQIIEQIKGMEGTL